jgi:hypothetical protein
MRRSLLLGASSLTLFGCHFLPWRLPYHPTAGMIVKRTGTDYSFEVRNCRDPRQRLNLASLTVWRLEERAHKVHCELRWTDVNVPSLTSSWMYGSVPPGYQSEGCLPLESGKTYEIRVGAGAGSTAVFALDTAGVPRMVADGCSERPD